MFGKRVLVTDRDTWPVTEVVAAYRSQSEAEFGFRQLTDPHTVSFSPMYHWTDHSIRVHTFTCVLALQVAHLMRRQAGQAGLHVLKGYVYRTPCGHRPFKRLRELYLIRKEGNPSEGLSKIIKLLINSVYGKTAQAIGGRTDDYGDYRPPTYQCHIWAAWMTGGTRAKVLDAALRSPENVVSIATDGILSTNRCCQRGRGETMRVFRDAILDR